MLKFPTTRLRRKRTDFWLRELLKDNYLNVNDLILPLFVTEGVGQKQVIKTLPDIYRFSIDNMLEQVDLAVNLGIRAIALFPVISTQLKSWDAKEAYNENNLICRVIKAIKKEFPDQIGVIADVALDPYNLSGHDGLLIDGKIDNDKTIEVLAKQAAVLAAAGADIVAPSDMMDGRVGKIRNELDKINYQEVKILSYAVKFASHFYGPFRDAVGSQSNLGDMSKETYQMSYELSTDMCAEVELDLAEGADFIMVKPAMAYLDVVQLLSSKFDLNLFTYHVSGEYASLKAAAQLGYLDYYNSLIESLLACKRAGASAIFCYDAINLAKRLKERS
jgi:porphobilinogen synthase